MQGDQLLGGGLGHEVHGIVEALLREPPIDQRVRDDLQQVRGGATHDDDRRGPRDRGVGDPARGFGVQRRQLRGTGWVMLDQGGHEACGSDPDAAGERGLARSDDHDLGAATADVDDHDIVLDGHPAGHAEQREDALLVMLQDVDWDPRGLGDLRDHPMGIGGAAQGLRGHDRDIDRAQAPGDVDLRLERAHQLVPGVFPQELARAQVVAEAEERRFVVDRLQPMPVHLGDQQVDRRRPDVDGGADERVLVRGTWSAPIDHPSADPRVVGRTLGLPRPRRAPGPSCRPWRRPCLASWACVGEPSRTPTRNRKDATRSPR